MKQILLCFLSILSWTSIAQPHLNDTTSQIGGGPGYSILVTDSSYITASADNYFPNLFEISEIDFHGNITRIKYFPFDSSVAEIHNYPKCLKYNKSHIYTAVTPFTQQTSKGDSIFVTFFKLDENFDTVLVKKHIQFENAMPYIHAMEFDSDSTFIVTGELVRISTPTLIKYDLWVARFDTSFNPIWERRLVDSYPNFLRGFVPTDIEIDQYGSVVVGGHGWGTSPTIGFDPDPTKDYVYYGFGARFDIKTGKLRWKKEFTQPYGLHGGIGDTYFLDNSDGTYSFLQHQFELTPRSIFGRDTSFYQIGIIDTSGQVFSSHTIGPVQGYLEPLDLYKTQDGNFYTSGHKVHMGKTISSSFKFTPAGDSLWFRDYYLGDSLDFNKFAAFQPTPDGGFVHICRWADLHNTQIYSVPTWLVKTDEFGCYYKDCNLSITTLQSQKAPKIYPIPASTEIQIQFQEDIHITATLIGVNGQVVSQQKLSGDALIFKIPEGTSNGIYTLQLNDSKDIHLSPKVIIQK